ncbi:MAG: LPS export ABC transporter periplasmic protein LptC [Candidatus Omnitrophota bacterium]
MIRFEKNYILKVFVVTLLILGGKTVFSQQKIQDFYLSNYKEDGGREWEVKGKEAVVSQKYVDIDKMEGTYFQSDDKIDVKADKARLDKDSMDVHLEDNVKVNNEKGVTLNTEVLDWQKNTNTITTDRDVEVIKEDSLEIKAKGMDANTELKKVNFQREVRANVIENNDVVKIDCDGPLEIEYTQGQAIFYNNVVVDNIRGKMFSQKATVFFNSEENRIIKIIAEGDVKIIRDDNVTFAERAIYLEANKKVTLEGRPRLVIFPDRKSSLDATLSGSPQ